MESKLRSQSEFQSGVPIVFQIYQTPPHTVCDSDCRNISHTRTQAQLQVNHSHLTTYNANISGKLKSRLSLRALLFSECRGN